MKMIQSDICCRAFCWLALILAVIVPAANAAVQVIGTRYQQDQLYPEWKCYWHDDCHLDIPGGNVHVYVKNTGAASVSITDVTLAGYSLKTVIKADPSPVTPDVPSSIFFYWNNPPPAILNAGDPAWYKGDPTVIPPGGVAQAVMHLRAVPTTPTVSVGVVTTDGTVTTNAPIDATAPQLVSVGFSTNRTEVYLHWRRLAASGSAVPTTIKLDGVDVTAITTTVSDPTVNFGVSVIHLAQPLDYMSYHVFQGVYADGKTATGSLRAWSHPFLYATWGTFPYADDNTTSAQNWITEATQHGFNAAQNQGIGGALGSYLGTSAGKAYAAARGGYGVIIWQTGASDDPLMSFLEDEPDAIEARLEANNANCGNLPCGKSPMGVLAMREIAEGETYRALHPLSPTTLNVDGSWRPLNYIAWGQAVDVLQVDPYYQMRLLDAYGKKSVPISLYLKATYIYAVTKATVTAAEPNPAHPILFSTERLDESDGSVIWPFPTTEAKRIEVYYALAAGAKGMSYWWMNPGPKFNGMGNQNKPESRALWKEMGLLGNEIKTVGPLIVISHPVDLPITPGPNVWAKGLASGDDTLVLFAVNDNYYNDTNGCHYTPVANATLTATLPAWMLPAPMVFEVTASGLKAANTQLNGNQLQINLGTLQLTRMIVVTKNPQVPWMTQQRFDQQVRPGICAFASEFCTNSAPAIVVPPQSQTVLKEDNAFFTVAASGAPLPKYQWRFKGTNLAGATGDTYTRTNAQTSHEGDYSVVVSNSLGVVTSAVAILSVSTNGLPPHIVTPPQSQTVEQNQNATFIVTADGPEPFSYQWRFAGTNLAGATDSSYTRFNVQPFHAGEYSVVVANAAGAITSAPATLTITVLCTPVTLVNGNFEGGHTGGVATGWTSYEVNSPTIKVWVVQNALAAPGGNNYQQIQAYNDAHSASAGVRQNITGCTPGATYQISGWHRSNSDNGRARVRVSPGGSTDWNTAVDLNPVIDYGVSTNWATFSGTVVATGTSMTLWLDGRTIAGTSAKVGCFDAVTVTCVGPTATPRLEYQRHGTNLVFRWPTNYGNYGLITATNVDGASWTGALPAPSVVNGTNVVTNAMSGQRKFFRLKRP